MKIKKRLAIVVLIVAVGAVALLLVRHRNSGQTLVVSGTVEATEAQLGFQTPGRIEAIMVHEGDMVKAGDELARLDRAELQARRQQAEAQMAAANALLSEFEHGARPEELASARATRDAAQDRLNDAQRDFERTKQLHEGGAVSKEIFDKASLQYDIAKSQLTLASEQLRLVESGPRRERIDAQRAVLAQTEAAVRTVDVLLDNMTMRAALDGQITVRHREPGEIVSAGAAILTLMNRDDRWVRIYIPEDRVGAARIGQTATITADTYPDKTYHGQVIQIASEAEFTPKTVQTTEERVKLVYAVKVRITDDPSCDLKPGMPADVVLDRSSS